MLTVYRILTGLILIYGIGHMIYTFYDDHLASPEAIMWFFSAGLAMLFNGFINLINLMKGDVMVKKVCIMANLLLLAFLIVLSVVVPEIQVYILDIIILATLIVSSIFSRTQAFPPENPGY